MKRFTRTIGLVLSGICVLGSNDRHESNEKKHSTPTIIISFDGAQPGVIERMLREGRLAKNGGFGTLMREGTRADGMTAVLPTVTVTNHITLATGAYPERTNIP